MSRLAKLAHPADAPAGQAAIVALSRLLGDDNFPRFRRPPRRAPVVVRASSDVLHTFNLDTAREDGSVEEKSWPMSE
ncbi:MAG: hypothetical protein ACXW0R_05565 [Gaiellaceae bacterium]